MTVPIADFGKSKPVNDSANGYPRPDKQQEQERAEAAAKRSIRCLSADEFFAEETDANLIVPVLGICAGPPIGTVSENSSEVRELLRVMTRASDATDAGVAMIHHGGKTPDEMTQRTRKEMARGSSAIVDEFQSMFVMSKKKGDAVTLVTHEKDRELGQVADDFGLRIEDVAGGDDGRDPKWGLRVVHVDRAQLGAKQQTPDAKFVAAMSAVHECIQAHPGIAGADAVAERVSLRAATVRAAVKQLIADGDVVSRPAPRGGVRLYLKHAAPAGELVPLPSPRGGKGAMKHDSRPLVPLSSGTPVTLVPRLSSRRSSPPGGGRGTRDEGREVRRTGRARPVQAKRDESRGATGKPVTIRHCASMLRQSERSTLPPSPPASGHCFGPGNRGLGLALGESSRLGSSPKVSRAAAHAGRSNAKAARPSRRTRRR